MVSAWWMVAHYLLPLPLILFALLALPGPKSIRRGILLFCTRVFDLPLIGIFRLLHVAFFLTGIAFFGAFRQLRALRDQQQLGIYGSPNQEIALLSKKWRTERNLWCAGLPAECWTAEGLGSGQPDEFPCCDSRCWQCLVCGHGLRCAPATTSVASAPVQPEHTRYIP
ncbi:hypothetical protein ACKKBG_A07295 [Auxenochlorella protothecoides x Auxenochlorella symbiontica]